MSTHNIVKGQVCTGAHVDVPVPAVGKLTDLRRLMSHIDPATNPILAERLHVVADLLEESERLQTRAAMLLAGSIAADSTLLLRAGERVDHN